MTVDKPALLRDLDDSWNKLTGLVDSLSEPEVLEPGVVEEWSVKDLLGHMAFWANKAAGDLDALKSGRESDIETPGGDEIVAAWNARESAARKDKTLEQLRSEWTSSFQAARAALESTPADRLDTEVKGWPQIKRFLEDTTVHYREHREQISTWLKQLETTEA